MNTRPADFRGDESGAATIEAVLWLPLFIFLFVMILDAAMIFTNHSRALKVIHDANRAYATGTFTSCAQVTSFIEGRVQVFAPTAVAACSRSGGFTTASVSMSSGELDLSGATGMFGGLTVVAQSQQLIEPGA